MSIVPPAPAAKQTVVLGQAIEFRSFVVPELWNAQASPDAAAGSATKPDRRLSAAIRDAAPAHTTSGTRPGLRRIGWVG